MASEIDTAEDLATISETDRGWEFWRQKSFVSEDLGRQLADANFLLVPQEGFRDFDGPLFPVGTEEFFRFLREKAPPEVKVDLCVSDDDYKELALHAELLILAGVVVTTLIAPVVVNLVSEYLKKRLWPGETDRGVKFQMVLQEADREKQRAVGISYEGPADKFQETMVSAIESVRQSKTRREPQVVDAKVLPPPKDDEKS